MITDKIKKEIITHAAEESPRESCGLVVVKKGKPVYIKCRNIAEKNEHFVIHPEDQQKAEDAGEVIAVVHSHPFISLKPSEADLVGCEATQVPWVIVNHPTGEMVTIEPSGYKAPLIGRTFHHGVLDCYSLIRDYYKEVLSIALPDFERRDEWWLKGENLYLDGFSKAGFVEVQDMKEHDVLLMKVASKVPNHGAVLEKNGTIIHHQMGRLSSRDVYGGWYRKVTVKILRHSSLC